MPESVLVRIPSHNLTKALLMNSYDVTPVSYPLPTFAEPPDATLAPVAGQNYVQGYAWDAGEGGDHVFNRLYLQPYCEGPAGSQFWVRLYGWRRLGQLNHWVPTLLVQFLCSAGDLPGSSVASGAVLIQTENLCDTMLPVSGSVGMTGEVVSSGSGFGAYALVELRGCKKFSFEFEQADNVGMNALWSPC